MTIKPKKNMILYIFCICFAFILINSTIVLTFSNNYREVFGQGYIPPPSNSIQSKSFLCSQVGYSGPTYTGPDCCATTCTTTGENIPKGCPVNPIDKGEDIHIG